MKAGAAPVIVAAVQQQLAVAGYIARNGQLIDATIVRAPVQHFSRQEKEVLSRGEIPGNTETGVTETAETGVRLHFPARQRISGAGQSWRDQRKA